MSLRNARVESTVSSLLLVLGLGSAACKLPGVAERVVLTEQVSPSCFTESFRQPNSPRLEKLDLLFVVDTSAS
jgi:hypothetical protein